MELCEDKKPIILVVDDVENMERMAEVLNAMYEELPEPKKKTKRK